MKNNILKLRKNVPLNVLYEIMDNEFYEVINCIEDGVFISDGNANILSANDASVAMSSMTREELIGGNIYEMIEQGKFTKEEVCTTKAIETKEKTTLIQSNVQGKFDILATSTPYIEDGEVKKVITTERDISQIMSLQTQLKKDKERAQRYKQELEYYRKKETAILDDIVSESSKMAEVIKLATDVAKSDVTVLIQGETGVGKEVISNLIQQKSRRQKKPFIKINCSAIPNTLLESELFGYEKGAFTGALDKKKQGYFELANNGTILLDEVDTIPLHLQSKLLRVLQEGEIFRIGGTASIGIDVRVIAATNSDLKAKAKNGTFREDLYYRLNVVPIKLPPLRKRKEDIIPLAKSFISQYNKKHNLKKELSESAYSPLLRHDWPGNVRELENLIERLIVTGTDDVITENKILHLLAEDSDATDSFNKNDTQFSLKDKVDEFEKKIIQENMVLYNNSVELANALGIDKATLNRKIKKLNIKPTYGQ